MEIYTGTSFANMFHLQALRKMNAFTVPKVVSVPKEGEGDKS